MILGDGFDIPDSLGTFDRIIVTAAMEQIPEKLLERLEPGGVLIAPVGPHHGIQTLVRVVRTEAGFDRKELVDVRFVPALPGIARELERPDWPFLPRPYSQVKPLFTRDVFTQNSILLRTSE